MHRQSLRLIPEAYFMFMSARACCLLPRFEKTDVRVKGRPPNFNEKYYIQIYALLIVA
jgi:hypothetical protein